MPTQEHLAGTVLIAALSLMLSACGQQHTPPSPAPVPLGSLVQILPAPADLLSQTERSSSALDDLSVGGDSFLSQPASRLSAGPAGTGLGSFSPDFPSAGRSGLAYGIYQFNLATLQAGAGSLQLIWASYPASGELYVGLSDFALNRWRFVAVSDFFDSLAVPSVADVRAPDGRSFVAVVLAGSTAAELAGASYGYGGAEPLHSLSAAPGNLGAGQAAGMLRAGGKPLAIIIDGADPLNVKLQANPALNVAGSSFSATPSLLASGLNTLPPLDRPGFASVNSAPAVAFRASGSGGVQFRAAADPAGASWNPPVTVDAGSIGAGARISLAAVNGNPALAYDSDDPQAENRRLRFTRASDAAGTTWPASATELDYSYETGTVLAEPVLAVIGGRPAIAYYFFNQGPGPDFFNGIRYVYANDADGAGWGAPVDVISFNSSAQISLSQLRLVECNGVPGVFWFETNLPNATANRAMFALGNDAAGSSFDVQTVLDIQTAGSGLRSAACGQLDLGLDGNWLFVIGESFVSASSSTLSVFLTPIGHGGVVDWTGDMRYLDSFDIFDANRSGSAILRRASNGDYPGDFSFIAFTVSGTGAVGDLVQIAAALNGFYTDFGYYDAFAGSFRYPVTSLSMAPVVERGV